MMLGPAKRPGDIERIRDLRAVDCDILTLDSISGRHGIISPIERYVTPDEFAALKVVSTRRRISSRRVRPAGAQLVSRMGARSIRN
jgi:lipoate synthase